MKALGRHGCSHMDMVLTVNTTAELPTLPWKWSQCCSTLSDILTRIQDKAWPHDDLNILLCSSMHHRSSLAPVHRMQGVLALRAAKGPGSPAAKVASLGLGARRCCCSLALELGQGVLALLHLLRAEVQHGGDDREQSASFTCMSMKK